MKYKETYSDEYLGIAFELVRWGYVDGIGQPYIERDSNPIWNIYLFIDTNRIPEDRKPKSFLLRPLKENGHVFYDDHKHPVLNNIEFHGGITFYEPTGQGRIKIGCDYNHYPDHHSMYSFRYLLSDAHRAIDSFLGMIPNYKRWCCGNGKIYDKSEGVLRDNVFYSKEYWGDKHPEWFQEETE